MWKGWKISGFYSEEQCYGNLGTHSVELDAALC